MAINRIGAASRLAAQPASPEHGDKTGPWPATIVAPGATVRPTTHRTFLESLHADNGYLMRFVLIDRIDLLEPGRVAEGYKRIAIDEDYFQDHFPGYRIVPGVLVLESLAQLGGRLVEASVRDTAGRRVLPMLAKIERAKFVRPVHPGDRLDLRVEATAITAEMARVTGTARVGGRVVATAAVLYALLDTTQRGGVLNDEQVSALHEWSDRISRELRGGSQ